MSNIFLVSYLTIIVVFIAWMLITVKDKILPKIIVLTSLTFITVFVSTSFESYKGWPSNDLPKNGKVIAIGINPGKAIFAWIYVTELNKKPTIFDNMLYYRDDQPRAFEITYSKEEEKKWRDAANQMSKGSAVYFKSVKKHIKDGKTLEEGMDVPSLDIVTPQQLLPKL